MWTTLLIVTAIFLIALRIFLTVHNQIEVISAGLITVACLMIALGVAPLALKLLLLLTIFLTEWWLWYQTPISDA